MSDSPESLPDHQIRSAKVSQSPSQAKHASLKGSITVIGAAAIGVGGMMGAGIYTLVGLAATTTGVWLPVAFLVGGIVSAFSIYSYAKLGNRFPSRGGAAQFLVQGFGDGIIAGGLNIFQFLGYVITIALYAVGFSDYAQALLPADLPGWSGKAIAVGLVVLFVIINVLGSRLVSRSETFIIGIELVILIVFVILGFLNAHPGNFADSAGNGVLGIFFGAGLLYVTYEGFGVVTNTADQMKNPRRELALAMYASLVIVVFIYVLVSIAIILTLTQPVIVASQGHVLAEAGRALLGRTGFVIVSIAALLATASAVNATLFGDANLSYQVSKDGELPRDFTHGIWHGNPASLFIVAGFVIIFVLFFPLSVVGQMASLAFLIVYGSVSLSHLRIRTVTGAKAWLLWIAVILNFGLFLLLLGYTISTGSTSTWITLLGAFALSFVAEAIYRNRTGRRFVLIAPKSDT